MEMIWDEDTIAQEMLDSYDVDDTSTNFIIDTIDTAAWASRVLQKEAEETQRLKEWAAREIARINEIVTRHETSAKSRAEFLEGHLHSFINREREQGNLSKKSMDLPGGKIGVRAGRAKIVVEDEESAVHYLEEVGAGGAVNIKKSVYKSTLTKMASLQGGRVYLAGEQVPGMYSEPAEETFYFKPLLDE